jgi:hypothetical protein
LLEFEAMSPRLFSYFLLSLLLTGSAACVSKKDRLPLLKGIRTTQLKLSATRSNAPDFIVTVPEGFESEWIGEEKSIYDKFYIFNRNDTGAIQLGMAYFDITPAPRWLIPDSVEYTRSGGSIAGHDIEWREDVFDPTKQEGNTFASSNGKKLFRREMISKELIQGYNSTKGEGPLLVHAFIVGSDSLLVERLTASIETIVVTPRPNL